MLRERIALWGEATFTGPASAEALEACEGRLGDALPDDLRRLLSESDGIVGEYGLGLLWSTDRIAEDNAWFRSYPEFAELYMPFDGMVFFADAGNGDQFGLSLSGNQDVYAWNHEDDSRTWVAPTVMRYLEEWMTGRLTL